VGAGTGYYTAILATMTGDQGKVYAYEIDPGLAARATANLNKMPNVTVIASTATEGPLPPCDAMYVNAAATGPMDCWLDALKPNGRLIFPLTPADVAGRPTPGMMLLITRRAENAFDARFICQAAFTPCIGGRDPETAAKLSCAFARGDARNVRSLRRDRAPDETCWCGGQGWWLSTRASQLSN
jgi:protein-L-isoaspartate(D-aspartate) O-methyltransferase